METRIDVSAAGWSRETEERFLSFFSDGIIRFTVIGRRCLFTFLFPEVDPKHHLPDDHTYH